MLHVITSKLFCEKFPPGCLFLESKKLILNMLDVGKILYNACCIIVFEFECDNMTPNFLISLNFSVDQHKCYTKIHYCFLSGVELSMK